LIMLDFFKNNSKEFQEIEVLTYLLQFF
jgi:hypothetical protein